ANWTDEQWQAVTALDEFWVQISLAGIMSQAIFLSKSATSRTTTADGLPVADRLNSCANVPAAEPVSLKGEGNDSQQLPSDIRHARTLLSSSTVESEIDVRLQQINTNVAVVLLDGWLAVEAVAEAVFEKKTLSGQEIGSIIKLAMAQIAAEKRFAAATAAW